MSHDSKFAIFGNWSSTILDFLLLLLAWLLPREGGGGRQLPNCCSKTGVGGAAPFLSFFFSWQNIPHPPLITLIHPSYRVSQKIVYLVLGLTGSNFPPWTVTTFQPPNLETWENPFLGTLYSCVHNDGFLFSSLSPSSQVGRRSNFETWRRPRPRAICGRG